MKNRTQKNKFSIFHGILRKACGILAVCFIFALGDLYVQWAKPLLAPGEEITEQERNERESRRNAQVNFALLLATIVGASGGGLVVVVKKIMQCPEIDYNFAYLVEPTPLQGYRAQRDKLIPFPSDQNALALWLSHQSQAERFVFLQKTMYNDAVVVLASLASIHPFATEDITHIEHLPFYSCTPDRDIDAIKIVRADVHYKSEAVGTKTYEGTKERLALNVRRGEKFYFASDEFFTDLIEKLCKDDNLLGKSDLSKVANFTKMEIYFTLFEGFVKQQYRAVLDFTGSQIKCDITRWH
jgi:hypothetical protein